MQIHPVRSERDYEDALAIIDELWNAQPGTPEFDDLDVVSTLVEDYERRHHAIDLPDPIAAIKFRMEQQNLTRKDLEGIIGNRARVSEVLAGIRRLSLAMIQRLHAELDIPAEVLIRPIPKRGKSSGRSVSSRARTRVQSRASSTAVTESVARDRARDGGTYKPRTKLTRKGRGSRDTR